AFIADVARVIQSTYCDSLYIWRRSRCRWWYSSQIPFPTRIPCDSIRVTFVYGHMFTLVYGMIQIWLTLGNSCGCQSCASSSSAIAMAMPSSLAVQSWQPRLLLNCYPNLNHAVNNVI